MKLIVLYGPPAVGKYTIGKMLAERLGYRFLHNHLIVNVAASLFSVGSPEFMRFGRELSFKVFEEAMRGGVSGIVSTFVYEKGVDDEYVRKTISFFESRGGSIIFIRLQCAERERMERVKHTSRKDAAKLTSPSALKEILKDHTVTEPIPFIASFFVDTTGLKAEESLKKVLEYVGGISE